MYPSTANFDINIMDIQNRSIAYILCVWAKFAILIIGSYFPILTKIAANRYIVLAEAETV